MPLPIKFLILSVTEDCNLRCRYCYARAGESRKAMDWEIAKKALDLATVSGEPFKVQLSGGEPLLNFPLIEQMVEYSRVSKIPAYFQMQTNATLITPELAQKIKKLGLALGISLDGRVELNDQTRPLPAEGSSTLALVKGLQHLKEAKVGVGLTCVISQDNVESLDQVVEMAYYLSNVYNIGFDLLRLKGRGENLAVPTPNQVQKGVKKALAKAEALAALTGRTITFKQGEHVKWRRAKGENQGFGHCYAITGESLFVDPQGELYPCGSLAGLAEFRLGNLHKDSPEERKKQVSAYCREWMAPCTGCQDFVLCGGGCFARFYLASAHPHLPECTLKRTFIKQLADQKEENIND